MGMIKRELLLYVGASVFLLSTLGAMCFTESKRSLNPEPQITISNEATVSFADIGETVYIRARVWGLTSDHHEIVIANSPILNEHATYVRDRQLVYLDTTELYYKKVGPDGLEIHADMVEEVPSSFSSKIKVVQTVFNGADDATYFADHYKELGFTKISVYPAY